MNRFRMHKLGLRKNLADPAQDSVDDASLHEERPQQAEFILVERNVAYPPLADEDTMALHHYAADALEAGDIDTALSLSLQVREKYPTYWFNHRTVLEAYALSADCSREELMQLTLATIRGLENQRLGLLKDQELAPTSEPVPLEALAFEESRHWFNLGDDYETLSKANEPEVNLRRAASCFQQSRALLDPKTRTKMVVARLLREALVFDQLKEAKTARERVSAACNIDSAYVVSFVRARPYMKPLNSYLRERSNLP